MITTSTNEQFDEMIRKSGNVVKDTAEGQHKLCYDFHGFVVLKDRDTYDNETIVKKLSELQEQRTTIGRLKKLHGINIPDIVYYTTKANSLYQIQERAKGRPLGFCSVKSFIGYLKQIDLESLTDLLIQAKEEDFSTKLIVETSEDGIKYGKPSVLRKAITEYNNNSLKSVLMADDSLLLKYLEDFKTLNLTYGFKLDNHSQNFYFDENIGFTFIDVNLTNKNRFIWAKSQEVETADGKKVDPLVPTPEHIIDVEKEHFVIREAVGETFDMNPFGDEETRLLRNLLYKKAFRCLQQSSFNQTLQNNKLDMYLLEALSNTKENASDQELADFMTVVQNGKQPQEITEFKLKYSTHEPCIYFDSMDYDFIAQYLKQNPEFAPSSELMNNLQPKVATERKPNFFERTLNTFDSIVNRIKNKGANNNSSTQSDQNIYTEDYFDDYDDDYSETTQVLDDDLDIKTKLLTEFNLSDKDFSVK